MKTKNNRWGIVTAMLVSVAFLIALIVFQSAAALDQRQQPIALQPPFVFQVDDGVSASGFVPVPPSATRLLTETFGSGFSPSVGVTGTTTAWRVFTDTGSANYYWARVTLNLSATYADTAWAPLGGDGASLDPNSSSYPANMGTWLIYGPVDLSDYYAAEFTFNYLLGANPVVDGSGTGDYLGVAVSDDGTTFSGFQLTGDLAPAGWLTGTFNLADYAAKSSVYLGFYFHSNGDGNVGRSVFLDNVSLRAAPYLYSYMPVVAKNFALVTPTPQFVFNYRFDSGQGENDPDFVAWGQSYTSKSGDTTLYEQGLFEGNPGSGMYLYNTQLNQVTLAGPNVSVSGNYEISADFKVRTYKENGRYGLIFGAESSTFGRGSGNRPTFNINTHYYKFSLQFDAGNNIPDDYQLERCETDGTNCVDLIVRTSLPSGAAVDGVWDTVTIRRSGSSIVLLVNGFQINTATDGSYTGAREFGMFIQSASFNNTTNPLEISFDNYRVSQLP